MDDSGLISFFRVEDCGLYRIRRNAESEFKSDDFTSVSKELYDWLKDRNVLNTIPWDPSEHPRRDKVYCKDVTFDEATGDYLFVLWFANSDAAGEVGGIDLNAKVGETTNDSEKIEAKNSSGKELTIGKAMYYWFIPSLNLVASINFKHSKADNDSFTNFVKRWFDNKHKHPNKNVSRSTHEDPRTGLEISRVSVSYLSDDRKYSMSFKFKATEKETNIFSIDKRQLAKKISHVVIRDTVSTTAISERSSGVKLWDKLSKKKVNSRRTQQIEVVEQVTLSEDEIDSIIKLYEDEIKPNDTWNNIGFREVDSGNTKWFSSYTHRPKILINENLKHNKLFFNAETMWKEITDKRDDLLLNMKSHLESEVQTKEKGNESNLEAMVKSNDAGLGHAVGES
ncbi:hypothetical protein [Pseudoalteromonas lipolytica]|uniref:Uncharacterized protein n=1 Tax=Pseudoalteromonas lipolytica TaxID=570156 RepID=A0A0P7EKK8_9GAMM|nr:hypothetical protein [Pseudoalteromonas lipolytica]KPM85513.1 hypothetical protein AOG27_01645 [Pseudoalteromonas lipolytica]